MIRYVGIPRPEGGVYDYGAEKLDTGNILNADVAFLDSGNAASYSGSGQTWTNIVEYYNSTEHDFFLGADGSSGADDPTFNGTAGLASSSTYFSVDGGDFFTLAGANSDFLAQLQRSTATFTVLLACNLPDVTTTQYVFGNKTSGGATDYGVWSYLTGGALGMGIYSSSFSTSHTVAISTGANVIGMAYDGSGTNLKMILNGAVTNKTMGANSDTATTAATTFRIGATGALTPLVNTSRIYAMAFWSTYLSDADIQAQSAVLERRLGI